MNEEALEKKRRRESFAGRLKEAAGAPLLSRLLGPGRPLDLDAQQRMEALFGRSLSEVRIHDTRQAGEIANRLGAEAFTIGPRIFAGPYRLTPSTPQGLALLAHELTHFVQQIQPSTIGVVPLPVPGEIVSLPLQPIKAPLQMQLAAEVPAAEEPDALEAQALAIEQTIQGMAREAQAAQAVVDPHQIADTVYRLMQNDLRLEKERGALM